MKKAFITLFLILSFTSLMAPPTPYPTFYISTPTVLHEPNRIDYEPLIKAITWYESGNDTTAFNPREYAVGAFQIRPVRVAHYNALTNSNYTIKDCYNYGIAKKIFLHFAYGKSYEQAAKNWNGSGPMTITYWENVKKLL